MLSPLVLLVVARPPTDAGVWLDDALRSGTVVTAPLDVRGETQAPEGVLRVDLYVLPGTSPVASYSPRVPLGTIPFSLRWDPAGLPPGTVTIRVVATTLLRGFSAEVTGLVVPGPVAVPHQASRPVARVAVARAMTPRPAPAPRVLDDSGATFGVTAPALPYVRPVAPLTHAAAAGQPRPPPERSGWVSLAGGLLVLLVCSHLHRVLRSGP